jgi:uncharacterized protein
LAFDRAKQSLALRVRFANIAERLPLDRAKQSLALRVRFANIAERLPFDRGEASLPLRTSRRGCPLSAALLVIAKAPVAGRVKTRLTPPCTPAQAAGLAAAALADTLAAAGLATRAARRVLVLDGEPDGWVPDGFDVLPQRGAGLAARLAAAFDDAGGPAFLVGMDTPQLTPALLDAGLAALDRADAAFGAALDGGYWGIGLRRPDPEAFRGVPMSEAHTGAVQRARLSGLGLRTALLPPLRDVDTIADARCVAALAPRTRFAAALAAIA